MLKPTLLRAALLARVPLLQTEPDRLSIALEPGRVVSTLASSLSFEYQYPLRVTLSQYPDDEDALMLPLLLWLRDNQPDQQASADKRQNTLLFSRLENGDFSVLLQLTERVIVSEIDGALHATHVPEPAMPEPVARPWQLYINHQLVSEWPANRSEKE